MMTIEDAMLVAMTDPEDVDVSQLMAAARQFVVYIAGLEAELERERARARGLAGTMGHASTGIPL